MTPVTVARFMASLFPPATLKTCSLLDAGAGVRALSSAFLERWLKGSGFNFEHVDLNAYEIDMTLRAHLAEALASYAETLPLAFQTLSEDFISAAAVKAFQGSRPFTHAVLDPPYKKISSSSQHCLILRRAGIETVNLYSAFVALALLLMEPGGQLVAIIPRSFCNGPYYRPFRDFLLNHAAIHHIHLFASRNDAFKDDDVLQENVIIRPSAPGTRAPSASPTRQTTALRNFQRTNTLLTALSFPATPKNLSTCRLRLNTALSNWPREYAFHWQKSASEYPPGRWSTFAYSSTY